VVTHYVLILHFQKVGCPVRQEAPGYQRPPVGGTGAKPLNGPRQLLLFPIHQRQVVRILPLLNNIVSSLGTSKVFVPMFDFWGIFAWKPIRSDEINVLIAKLPKS
jgi:hypothetical protein